jgi:putative Mn2+ efflux pump MntP
LNYLTIFLIAVGLAMDCFAVSISGGMMHRCLKVKDTLKIAFSFGFFQALMPVIGWLLGISFKEFISQVDHWIAFSILGFIGVRMIYEALKKVEKEKRFNINSPSVLLSLSIATSIDALIVGVSFAFLETEILKTILIIGVVTFLISVLGLYLGRKQVFLNGKKAEIIGGLVLIGIGAKILLEHLEFFIF